MPLRPVERFEWPTDYIHGIQVGIEPGAPNGVTDDHVTGHLRHVEGGSTHAIKNIDVWRNVVAGNAVFDCVFSQNDTVGAQYT